MDMLRALVIKQKKWERKENIIVYKNRPFPLDID